MPFCFSFEVFVTLNPIQVNVKGGGLTQEGGGENRIELSYIGRYSLLQNS